MGNQRVGPSKGPVGWRILDTLEDDAGPAWMYSGIRRELDRIRTHFGDKIKEHLNCIKRHKEWPWSQAEVELKIWLCLLTTV